jgi:hypothetical protein
VGSTTSMRRASSRIRSNRSPSAVKDQVGQIRPQRLCNEAS